MSRRRGRLHDLMPGRSIQSAPLCRCQTEIERVQIVDAQSFSARFASVYRFCVASL